MFDLFEDRHVVVVVVVVVVVPSSSIQQSSSNLPESVVSVPAGAEDLGALFVKAIQLPSFLAPQSQKKEPNLA